MDWKNLTSVSEFIIVGFPGNRKFQGLLSFLFLVMYLLTISSNAVIVVTTRASRQLHTPMYFLLGHFSLLEIFYTSSISPPLLAMMFTGSRAVSFTGCMMQLYLFLSMACVENFLLAAMAYDRYVAVCDPLRYSEVISRNVCILLASVSWIAGFLTPIVPTVLTSLSFFCGPNVIDHFFCDLSPVLRLSCSDTNFTQRINSGFAAAVLLGTCLVTIVSYGCIASAIIKIPSISGKRKAFSTCASHLLVVSIFYGTGIFSYVIPTAQYSFNLSKFVSVVYTMVTPMANPFIYTLRNKDVTQALRQLLNHKGSIRRE